MGDSRSRPARRSASSVRRQAVGGPERRGVPVFFVGAVVAVVVAFVILISVAADAFGGGDNGGAASPPGETPEATATDEPTNDNVTPGQTPPPANTPMPTAGADGTVQVTCGDILAPVDKQHKLPANCVPPDLQQLPAEFASGYQSLRAEAAAALLEMLRAAKADGYALYVNSSFRSFQDQEYTYNFWVAQNGKEYADRTSARPGHSEHQMGTTADIGWNGCELECTVGTPEAVWIAANAHKYGFIVSYPDGKEHITGYAYEPWHVRYVGKDVAAQVHASGLTLHEFLLR
jgi:D-alanyl-D-alanine carboxypeptidase